MKKFLVISDAHLITKNGKKAAYAPYVREMDIWMANVDHTTIISPDKIDKPLLSQDFKTQDFKRIGTTRLEFHTFKAAWRSIIKMPHQTLILYREMSRADHIHLRAPGNLTLLACIVQIFFPLKAKTAKYAGNWDPQASQPLSYRLQKWILSNTKLTRNMKVMAYGEWLNQTKNIEPFFTATYNEKEKGVFEKKFNEPLHFIFVGTLSQNKNPQLLVELVKRLNNGGIKSQAHFYGDGPMMESLKVQSSEFRVQSYGNQAQSSVRNYKVNLSAVSESNQSNFKKVSPLEGCPQDNGATLFFHGNQPAPIVKKAYQKAHFVFLASKSEGWPKAIAEGMWHGCIPIATPVSCVPWMLNYETANPRNLDPNKQRGILFENINQTLSQIENFLTEPTMFDTISSRAQKWSQQYTIEKFETAIKTLLNDKVRDN